MSRLERLLNLTAALLTAARPLTAAEIRERVPGYPDDDGTRGAFRRAFERDKDALREMGVPVALVEIEGVEPPVEGYVIRRDQYELRDPGLDADELAAVHLASAGVHLEGLRGTGGIWKLGGTPTDVEAPAVAALPANRQLVPLFKAAGERRVVTFDYRGEERTVEPWRLSFSRGHWYLDGWDRGRSAERQFRLDRMSESVALGEADAFDRSEVSRSGSQRPWEIGVEPPVEARVRIDVDQAGWAVDHLGPDAVVARGEDGSVVVGVTVANRDAFRSFVVGFLDHAEVLEPAELRDDMVRWLRALVPR